MSIHVRELAGPDEAEAATVLLAQIWGTSYDASPIPGDVVLSISAWGGCLLGAFDGEDLVGVTVGIAAAPHSDTLASLIAGVVQSHHGRGVGGLLKKAQRAWAAERGVEGIEWTYDPLVRRNAHFNLNRLGADVVRFDVERYPPIPDGINAGDPTDRFLVRLDVREAAPRDPADARATQLDAVTVLDADERGHPRTHLRPADRAWLVGTPADIETLRRADPAAGLAWRLAARDLFTTDRTVTGFTAGGAYLMETR
ncbi:MAG: GNAT family N-acetyltransferase [Mobilicoccus sp.]|nr:GNAT family N-acetyltransferase [Mobilicoccus sp.]